MSECMSGAHNTAALEMRLAQTSFVLDDARLYLDTHPCDPQALEYYRQKLALRQAAVADYIAAVGPVDMYNVPISGGEWPWVERPWPWQVED